MKIHLSFEKFTGAKALWTLLTALAGIWYICICVLHYLGQRPLWFDEGMVFESVKNFAPQDFFTQKLAAGQIFPKLYLFLIQRIAEPFSLNLLSVRFLSFFAMLSAFAVWMKIASYELKDRFVFFTYVLSWAGSSLLVYYSAELKPYSMDVLASGLFVFFLYNADKLFKENPKAYLASVVLLPLLGLVSYMAFLFYIFLLYHLLTVRVKNGFWLLCFLLYGVVVLATMSFVYFFDIQIAKANASTQGFDHIVSFESLREFFRTWGEGTMALFGRFFAERPRIFKRLAAPLGIIGFVYMFYAFFSNFRVSGYRFNSFRTIALVLYGELFILGALQRYPFCVPRTSLFFCPIVLLLIVEAIVALRKVNKSFSIALHGAYLLFLLIIAFGIAREAWSGSLGFAPLIW